jgi:hypothetical protein
MTDKDLYYDKYLKYKNKYLDLKVQIGGAIWYIEKLNLPRRKIYKAIDRTSIERSILIRYHYTDTHTLKITIKYDDNININLYFPSIITPEEYFKNKRLTKSIYEFKNRDDLIDQFILAIQYIIENITETKIKKFIINSIETFMLLPIPIDAKWSITSSAIPTNIFYEAIFNTQYHNSFEFVVWNYCHSFSISWAN